MHLSNSTKLRSVSSSSRLLAQLIQVHTKWDSIDRNSSSGPVNCGISVTGGQYDPNLACGYNSISCTVLNRTISGYNCNSSNYRRGNYGLCRVGDISGKFGAALPSQPNVFFRESSIQDYQPPYTSDYAHSNKLTGMWSSVVFRCLDNTLVLCAKLNIVHTGSSSVCPFSSPSNQTIDYSGTKCTECSNRRENSTILSLSAALIVTGCLLLLITGSLVSYACHRRSRTVPDQSAV